MTALFSLWLYFLKVGAVIIGGGYVIIPFIQAEVVGQFSWLTHREFLDGLALGQMMPGPITMIAAFVGYKVAGLAGAAVATVGMFLPGLLAVLLVARGFPRIKDHPWVVGGLAGLRPAVVGLLAAVTLELATQFLSTPASLLVALLALALLLTIRLPAWGLILAALAAGLFSSSL